MKILSKLGIADNEQDIKIALSKYNSSYREGEPEISDFIYDEILDYYESKFEKLFLLDSDGGDVYLNMPNGSQDKIDKFDKLKIWIGDVEEILLSPKFDGISNFLQNEVSSTRGDDGLIGNDVTKQFKFIKNSEALKQTEIINKRGECVISWEAFERKFVPLKYMHPRNAVSGLFNPRAKIVNEDLLSEVEFIEIGKFNSDTGVYEASMPFGSRKIKTCDLTEDIIREVYKTVSKVYPCDGVVVVKLGGASLLEYETNSINPKNSRAYKPKEFSQSTTTEVINIARQESKYGRLSPVLKIKSVLLDGANISSVYCDNEAFLKVMGIGIGSKIEIIRSGGIIPRLSIVNGIRQSFDRKVYLKRVHKILSGTNIDAEMKEYFNELKEMFGVGEVEYLYETPKVDAIWDGLDLKLSKETDEVKIQKILNFVATLGMKDIGYETLADMYYNHDIQDIKSFIKFEFEKLILFDQGYQNKKIKKFNESRSDGLKNIKEAELMKATSMFKGLGITHLTTYLQTGLESKGFGEVIQNTILENLQRWGEFKVWFLSNGFSFLEPKKDGDGEIYCHTKCRIPKENILILEENGHSVVDSYSKKVTVLVIPSFDETSSKIQKAKKDNVKMILLSELIMNFPTKKKENITDSSLF